MFTKRVLVLPAAGLGLLLLSDPALANWGSSQHRLSEKNRPAVAATAKPTRLAGELRGSAPERDARPAIPPVGQVLIGTNHNPRSAMQGEKTVIKPVQPGGQGTLVINKLRGGLMPPPRRAAPTPD